MRSAEETEQEQGEESDVVVHRQFEVKYFSGKGMICGSPAHRIRRGIAHAVKVLNKDAVCTLYFDNFVKSALYCAVGGFAVCVKIQDGAVLKMRAI